MQTYSLRRSEFDPEFLEIILDHVIVQEVRFPCPIKNLERSFSSLEEIFAWLEKTEEKLAKAAAYRFLSRRSFSKETLFQKLREKKFSHPLCRKVVEEMEKMGIVSDADFGEAVLRQKMGQGYGPQYIERYFKQLGLDPKLVREKMDEKAQRELVQKWMLKLRDKEKSKKIAFLLRRGFDFGLIQCK